MPKVADFLVGPNGVQPGSGHHAAFRPLQYSSFPARSTQPIGQRANDYGVHHHKSPNAARPVVVDSRAAASRISGGTPEHAAFQPPQRGAPQSIRVPVQAPSAATESLQQLNEEQYQQLIQRLVGVQPSEYAVDQLYSKNELRLIAARFGFNRILRPEDPKPRFSSIVLKLLNTGKLRVPVVPVKQNTLHTAFQRPQHDQQSAAAARNPASAISQRSSAHHLGAPAWSAGAPATEQLSQAEMMELDGMLEEADIDVNGVEEEGAHKGVGKWENYAGSRGAVGDAAAGRGLVHCPKAAVAKQLKVPDFSDNDGLVDLDAEIDADLSNEASDVSLLSNAGAEYESRSSGSGYDFGSSTGSLVTAAPGPTRSCGQQRQKTKSTAAAILEATVLVDLGEDEEPEGYGGVRGGAPAAAGWSQEVQAAEAPGRAALRPSVASSSAVLTAAPVLATSKQPLRAAGPPIGLQPLNRDNKHAPTTASTTAAAMRQAQQTRGAEASSAGRSGAAETMLAAMETGARVLSKEALKSFEEAPNFDNIISGTAYYCDSDGVSVHLSSDTDDSSGDEDVDAGKRRGRCGHATAAGGNGAGASVRTSSAAASAAHGQLHGRAGCGSERGTAVEAGDVDDDDVTDDLLRAAAASAAPAASAADRIKQRLQAVNGRTVAANIALRRQQHQSSQQRPSSQSQPRATSQPRAGGQQSQGRRRRRGDGDGDGDWRSDGKQKPRSAKRRKSTSGGVPANNDPIGNGAGSGGAARSSSRSSTSSSGSHETSSTPPSDDVAAAHSPNGRDGTQARGERPDSSDSDDVTTDDEKDSSPTQQADTSETNAGRNERGTALALAFAQLHQASSAPAARAEGGMQIVQLPAPTAGPGGAAASTRNKNDGPRAQPCGCACNCNGSDGSSTARQTSAIATSSSHGGCDAVLSPATPPKKLPAVSAASASISTQTTPTLHGGYAWVRVEVVQGSGATAAATARDNPVPDSSSNSGTSGDVGDDGAVARAEDDDDARSEVFENARYSDYDTEDEDEDGGGDVEG